MATPDDTYELLEDDPFSWLEQARGAQMSAELIRTALDAIMPLSQTLPSIREKKLAYSQSFMLLTAVAFENVLKGLAVAKKPKSWRDAKHRIAALAAKITTSSPAELELLERLEEYLVWAGRYLIPMTPQQYAEKHDRQILRAADRKVASAFFERLADELIQSARQNA
jgi:hypothetical protein